jgi:hypothetical protein
MRWACVLVLSVGFLLVPGSFENGRAEITRLKAAGANPAVYQEAEKLLEVPAEVCADTTHFTTASEPIHRHRAKLAEAIERLRGAAG